MQGNINLIDEAARSGVKRFVLVTSIGTGDSKDAPPAQVRGGGMLFRRAACHGMLHCKKCGTFQSTVT